MIGYASGVDRVGRFVHIGAAVIGVAVPPTWVKGDNPDGVGQAYRGA
jgi:hypothetical protein